MTHIISKTGRIHGRGSMPYRWVSGLTKQERAAVVGGDIVLIPDDHPRSGCDFKQVTYHSPSGRFSHRNYKP